MMGDPCIGQHSGHAYPCTNDEGLFITDADKRLSISLPFPFSHLFQILSDPSPPKHTHTHTHTHRHTDTHTEGKQHNVHLLLHGGFEKSWFEQQKAKRKKPSGQLLHFYFKHWQWSILDIMI